MLLCCVCVCYNNRKRAKYAVGIKTRLKFIVHIIGDRVEIRLKFFNVTILITIDIPLTKGGYIRIAREGKQTLP